MDSILFAVEKTGSEQLIDTARELVTEESRLLSGTRGQPAKLYKHIEGIARAFRRPEVRPFLTALVGSGRPTSFLERRIRTDGSQRP
jgi:hypothetical protein